MFFQCQSKLTHATEETEQDLAPMQNKPVELSDVQRLKYKMIHSRSHIISLFTIVALHSCLHYIPTTNTKSASKWFAFTSDTQQSFKSGCEQGCLLKRDSKNVPKVVSKVPEVEG